ncbi:MAG: hypothetical protein ABI861_08330 [Panacibacter sp.]
MLPSQKVEAFLVSANASCKGIDQRNTIYDHLQNRETKIEHSNVKITLVFYERWEDLKASIISGLPVLQKDLIANVQI